MKVYKIRHKITGLFSTGGFEPRFTKRGKTWTAMGHITLHVNMLRNRSKNPNSVIFQKAQEYLNSVEIVEFTTAGESVIQIPQE